MDLISIDSGHSGGYCDAYDSGESVMVDNWETVQMTWFQRGVFLSHIEVLDKPKAKGFK